ncbi:MAG: PLP-dependent aspartate aminotransferase family protein [Rhodospirillaceae bacterium]|nr:PLP-dependent aspartate aminotransferase family protein [Rhodospirillaceae bacterium]MCY4237841.1 PLP-dependent aspartate aminotransferase family protein [Rhodospirillaceae bacterium]MCY4310990.1 PLP-dependent aspartate aminotransferase family protein [Rhodospirillaceae bacterium]
MTRTSHDYRSLLAQAGHFLDEATGAVTPPIHLSVTYARDGDYAPISEYFYTRYGNPSFTPVESLLARLDNGAAAMLFASGLAGMAALVELVQSGQHIVAPEVMYFGAQAWIKRIARTRNIGLTLYNQSQPGALEAAIRHGETAMVWVETPVNPTWEVIDIAAAAKAAHQAGAVLTVDSTVAPGVSQRPLDHGADYVFHSSTKYLNGHSDILGGVVVARETNARWYELEEVRRYSGGVMGPFEAWLLLRGMRTLAVRWDAVCANAMAVAEHFRSHPKIERVAYPGLPDDPGHAVAVQQMTGGFGGMLSLLLKGGYEAANTVARSTAMFIPATSLGGVESLIEHRAVVESPDSMTPGNLVRLSCGIEAAADLIADLEQALERV